MIRKKLAKTLFSPIIFGFVVFTTSIEVASADELCKGACQTKYSKCQRVCKGDDECLSDCQSAHAQYLEKCGEGSHSGGGYHGDGHLGGHHGE
ncbi:Uncharacterised protein [Legionella busanensis]|uniref:Uncharacterized protein n=1 Tax=Legionella busanensis TaxID=190655 RepID=A0A378JJQ8_9GAMM|nr:hypothetical protein [Legionella busanensis]STX50449.1 Uncharacterised protein [Legionella busanensis]